jgi:hypothetical protein
MATDGACVEEQMERLNLTEAERTKVVVEEEYTSSIKRKRPRALAFVRVTRVSRLCLLYGVCIRSGS